MTAHVADSEAFRQVATEVSAWRSWWTAQAGPAPSSEPTKKPFHWPWSKN